MDQLDRHLSAARVCTACEYPSRPTINSSSHQSLVYILVRGPESYLTIVDSPELEPVIRRSLSCDWPFRPQRPVKNSSFPLSADNYYWAGFRCS